MSRNPRRMTVAAASAAAAIVLSTAIPTIVLEHSVAAPGAATEPPQKAPVVHRPLDNDCSGGHVTFTFDDGPRENTETVLHALDGFGIDAVFFWNGQRLQGRERTVVRALAGGHVIGNHTWAHPDLTTGEFPDGTRKSWDARWVRGELERTNVALVAAGAPRPTLYRPPYGAITQKVDRIAQDLGMRVVMPWAHQGEDNIVDTRDTEGVSPQEIVDTTSQRIQDGTIITMHDGQGQATLNSIDALQGIVDAMNDKDLCATTDVRDDAAGNVPETSG